MHDVREDQELDEELHEHRPPNHDFDEVLYADDTIIFSTDAETLQSYLHVIETTASKYGLTLNKKKCETINANPQISGTTKLKKGGNVKKKSKRNTLAAK